MNYLSLIHADRKEQTQLRELYSTFASRRGKLQNWCSCEGLCPGYLWVSIHRPGLIPILNSTILEAEPNYCALSSQPLLQTQ